MDYIEWGLVLGLSYTTLSHVTCLVLIFLHYRKKVSTKSDSIPLSSHSTDSYQNSTKPNQNSTKPNQSSTKPNQSPSNNQQTLNKPNQTSTKISPTACKNSNKAILILTLKLFCWEYRIEEYKDLCYYSLNPPYYKYIRKWFWSVNEFKR